MKGILDTIILVRACRLLSLRIQVLLLKCYKTISYLINSLGDSHYVQNNEVLMMYGENTCAVNVH